MGSQFATDLAELLNRASAEKESDTPDFVLAEYLQSCLYAFNKATNVRDEWYGRSKVANGTAVPLGE